LFGVSLLWTIKVKVCQVNSLTTDERTYSNYNRFPERLIHGNDDSIESREGQTASKPPEALNLHLLQSGCSAIRQYKDFISYVPIPRDRLQRSYFRHRISRSFKPNFLLIFSLPVGYKAA
jgi:hypothetical protein